jgi:hypothetical protein
MVCVLSVVCVVGAIVQSVGVKVGVVAFRGRVEAVYRSVVVVVASFLVQSVKVVVVHFVVPLSFLSVFILPHDSGIVKHFLKKIFKNLKKFFCIIMHLLA